MPVVNTEYDLLYNTDGNSVITIRDDKIPFAGVKSFAVETATTNYLAPYAWEFDSRQTVFYPSYLASGKTWTDCWDEKQKAYVGGNGLTCNHIYTRSIDLGSVQAAGTKITWSWKHKGYLYFIILKHSLDNTTFTGWNSADTIEYKEDSSFYSWEGSGLHIKIDGKTTDFRSQPEQLLDRWYNVEITYTLPSDTRYIQLFWDFYRADQANGGLGVLGYIRQPQLEIKPFASSFVNGSRPNGRLVISVDDLLFDIANDNWVVTYMKYPIATQDKTQIHQNLCSFGQATGDNSKGYISWGKKEGENKYCINLTLSDSTVVTSTSTTTFVPSNYFYKWHHEVVKREGNIISYYVDGTKQVTATIPSGKSLKTPFDLGLVMGGIVSSGTHYPQNSLFSNLAYGKLQAGEFTDSYIAFLASANKPFVAKPRNQIY